MRFRYDRILGLLAIVSSGISRRGHVDAIGRPIIQVLPGSSICLGRDVTIISASFATALGVNYPVVLRTLRPGAQIKIGDRVGISGGSICAAQLIEIGEESMLGANVTIADTDFHSLRAHYRRGHTDPSIAVEDVIISKQVFIGTNSIILKCVAALHAGSAILIHPTYPDNSPNSVAEAIASGLPVIASNVGGIPSMIENGATGLLVEPRNPRQLAEAITALLHDEAERKPLASRAKQVAFERHFPSEVAAKTLHVYRDIIAKEKRD